MIKVIKVILDALRRRGSPSRFKDGFYKAFCPGKSHRQDEIEPTLIICEVFGGVRFRCLSECDNDEILAAIGLTPDDLKGGAS